MSSFITERKKRDQKMDLYKQISFVDEVFTIRLQKVDFVQNLVYK